MKKVCRIAIFASGSGTNAENIVQYFKKQNDFEVSMILTNNKKAFVLERAKKLRIQSYVFSKEAFYKTTNIIDVLAKKRINFIVLAGFLWLIPEYLLEKYGRRILNIHPALLPEYGGKGMYGDYVHRAVINNEETESGITIHYVNENYDEGQVVFQQKVKVEKNDSADSLAVKIHQLEYKYYPVIIEQEIRKQFNFR